MLAQMFVPKPADPSANKPIYIVIAENPAETKKVQYFRADKLDRQGTYVGLRGFELTKAQAEKLREHPYVKEAAGREINYELPWHRVIRIEYVTYKKPKAQQGEENDN